MMEEGGGGVSVDWPSRSPLAMIMTEVMPLQSVARGRGVPRPLNSLPTPVYPHHARTVLLATMYDTMSCKTHRLSLTSSCAECECAFCIVWCALHLHPSGRGIMSSVFCFSSRVDRTCLCQHIKRLCRPSKDPTAWWRWAWPARPAQS